MKGISLSRKEIFESRHEQKVKEQKELEEKEHIIEEIEEKVAEKVKEEIIHKHD